MSPLYFGFFSSCTQPIECSPAPTTGSPRPCTGSQAPAQAPLEQPRVPERCGCLAGPGIEPPSAAVRVGERCHPSVGTRHVRKPHRVFTGPVLK
eukprot:scaffold19515_cov114-Isochrysis_galbana.AAC.1